MKYNKDFLLAFLIIFLSGYVCSTSSVQAQSPHGIILISLDTLRADHLGCYGYHRDTSPSIDAFAKEAILFEDTVAQSPWTLPSHMSIMTSLYPAFHGVRKYDNFLANEQVTLAELLKESGYQTAAFTDGGFLNAEFGFHQGFNIYEDENIGIANILPRVRKWLEENQSKPFFLFLHCYDIHTPYNPPPPYNTIFHDFTYRGGLVPSIENVSAANKNELTINSEDLRHFMALYDGEIRYADEKIGTFLSYLKDVGLYNQSLIIITSDHGEEFKEHDALGHIQLYYRPNLHIPLIMHIPNYPQKEVRISELVQSIDLLPTILDVAGLPSHPTAQGRSLLPLIKRYKNRFNHVLWRVFHPFTRDMDVSFAELFHTDQWSIIADGYQMIGNQEVSSMQLFNLKADPLEKTNIALDHADITERLVSQGKRLYNTKNDYSSLEIAIDEQTRKQLEGLGYIDLPETVVTNTSDYDGDGIKDEEDNCILRINPKQDDSDGDGVGDVCDSCPKISNIQQEDVDEDKIGDACDNCIDHDWDNYGNPGFANICDEDNCPGIFNPDQEDSDGDGSGDVCDNCLHLVNPHQQDRDEDNIGDACDDCVDTDLDGFGNAGFSNTCIEDNCSYTFNPAQEDEDGDGIGDVCEPLGFELYVIEAEQADTIVSPLEVVNDENASEGKCIYAHVSAENQYTPGSIMATYTVNISQVGTYILWGRVTVENIKYNSFFIQIDEGLDNLWDVAPGSRWHWDEVNNKDRTDPAKFILTEGMHTIKVKLREKGMKLDKLILTNNIHFVPRGTGAMPEKTVQETDGDDDDDGISDEKDNCPNTFNPDQGDNYPPQGNDIGDACDCEGDFNCDGSVDAADSSLFLKGFNQRNKLNNPCTNQNQCNGDFDCDGDVDENDMALFQADFGRDKNNNPCPDCEVGAWCTYQ